MQTKILLDRIEKDSPFAKAKFAKEGETTPISSKSIERPKQSEPDIPSEQPIPSPSENIDPAPKLSSKPDLLNYKLILQNLNNAFKDTIVIQNIDSYWKSFKSPQSQLRIRIHSNDFFSKPLTLLLSNEISSQMNKTSTNIEITLLAHDGTIIYK